MAWHLLCYIVHFLTFLALTYYHQTLLIKSNSAYEYGKAVQELGVEYNLPVVDAWTFMEGNSDNRQHYLCDGLHLNAK